eukprot:g729.t1
MSEYKCYEIRALKRNPVREAAQKILERVAAAVQPIMKKHKWRVKQLVEFCPKSASLLGMNVNRSKIMIRLRRSKKATDFLPYEHIVGTMLHELVHMKFSQHSAEFYELLDELKNDAAKLSSGETLPPPSFEGDGKRLGGDSLGTSLSLQQRREKALFAAKRRAQLSSLSAGCKGGRRLGGMRGEISGKLSSQKRKEIIAAAAFARANADRGGCQSVLGGKLVDVDNDDGDSQNKTVQTKTERRRQSKQKGKGNRNTTKNVTQNISAFTNAFWECERCTLINDATDLRCIACDAQVPNGKISTSQKRKAPAEDKKKKKKRRRDLTNTESCNNIKFRGTPVIDLTGM